MSDLTDLRARAEELLAENATADRPDPRSWMDGADRIIRDLLAALPADQPDPFVVVGNAIGAEIHRRTADLPPDPAPTGERMPCAGWVAHALYACAHLLIASGPRGMLRASVGYTAGADAHSWRLTASDNGTEPTYLAVGRGLDSMEAAQLAAEDAAAELLTAGLRALGRGGK